jgi:hypothetical protein
MQKYSSYFKTPTSFLKFLGPVLSAYEFSARAGNLVSLGSSALP